MDMEKIISVSELKEFAYIIEIEDKNHMLCRFAEWFRTTAYGFYLWSRRCSIMQNHYGSVEREWQEAKALAEKDYEQLFLTPFVVSCGMKQWFENVSEKYNERCRLEQECINSKMFIVKKWFTLLQIRWQKRLDNRKLSFVDILRIARSSYLQKGGSSESFRNVMKSVI